MRFRRYALLPVLLAVPAALFAADPPPETGGKSTSVITPVAQTVTTYRKFDVNSLIAKADNPSDVQPKPGLVMIYAPPVDVERDAKGRPLVGLITKSLGVKGTPVRFAGATELAKLVEDGKVPGDAEVQVGLTLVFRDDPELKRQLLDTFHHETNTKPAAPVGAVADKLVKRIQPAELALTCDSPGFDDKPLVVLKGNQSAVTRRTVQFKATAEFVRRALDEHGLCLAAHFRFDAYGDTVSAVSAEQTADVVLDQIANGKGKGNTVAALGARSEFRVVVSKMTDDRLKECFRAALKVDVRGGNEAALNVLLALMQRSELNLPGLAADQAQQLVDETLNLKNSVNAASLATSMKALRQKKELSETEYENLFSRMSTSSSGSGGGFSFLGIGGSKNDYKSAGEAQKSYARQFARHFAEKLDYDEAKGEFRIHPDVDYRLITAAHLTKAYKQALTAVNSGVVSRKELISPFNTARPTLDDRLGDLERRLRLGK